MATKKTEEPMIMEEKKTEEPMIQEEKQIEAPMDPWLQTVSIFIPRHRKGEEEQHFCSVNGRAFLVALDGQVHNLPLPIAEIMQAWMANEAKVDAMKEKIEERVQSINGIKVI